MRLLLQIVSWAALAVTTLAPVLFVGGQIALPSTKLIMLLATIAWFGATPFWMGHPSVNEELLV